MNKIIYIFTLLFFQSHALSECVHEQVMSATDIKELKINRNTEYFVLLGSRFINLEDATNLLKKNKTYTVQFNKKTHTSQKGYNDNYVTYYTYDRVQKYLQSLKPEIEKFNYEAKIIGRSIEKRNLYAIVPKKLSPDKKTILMFGRHHGDEGSANWIIEGFLNSVFSNLSDDWHSKYQLIVYPMINPDGAEKRTRYNANGRDLNRVWATNPESSLDEIKIVHAHLLKYKNIFSNILITLDMHGSFTEDFIFRVDREFNDLNFYNNQTEFIQQLAIFDLWQDGHYKISNGHPKMLRIYLAREFKNNALTHESIRDIPINRGRSINTLKEQGKSIYKSISLLY